MLKKNDNAPRIGQILLDYGLITQDQLTRALDSQMQTQGRLGSILEEMGFLGNDTLTRILSRQCDKPFINLFEVQVPREILNLVPFEHVKSLKIMPFKKSADTISLAMVDPDDQDAVKKIELSSGKNIEPYGVPDYQMGKAINRFEQEGYGTVSFEGDSLQSERIFVKSEVPNIFTLLRLMIDFRATDLHLSAGAPPSIRVDREIKRLSMPNLTTAQIKDFASEILTQDQMLEFEASQEMDFVLSISDTGRFRMCLYKQRNSISLSARPIIEHIPTVSELGLPEWLTKFTSSQQGLILIASPPGHGKSSTISSLVEVINHSRKSNIIKLENPIIYLHKHGMSNINQREVGIDTESLAKGLKHILRQDPDIIVIDELDDQESIAIALHAAEKGHLVICTMPALNTINAIDKIINRFQDYQLPQIRTQLAENLLIAFSQKLVPVKDSGSKILAYEKLAGSPQVSSAIREGNIAGLKSIIQGQSSEVLSIDRCLARLCLNGRITFEDGLKSADDATAYKRLIENGRA
ncbi:PilT/PilU family type 4a pilus ATPase [bacterium]|nr:PilT/PilU family type 4a pilus ATPase [bacterium]